MKEIHFLEIFLLKFLLFDQKSYIIIDIKIEDKENNGSRLFTKMSKKEYP